LYPPYTFLYMVTKKYYTIGEAADYLGKNPETLRRWDHDGKLNAFREPSSNYRLYSKEQLDMFLPFNNEEVAVSNFVKTDQDYKVLELFAGAGGLALGMEITDLIGMC
jgi:DNA (cytosine-5)-methyltransferase 1